MTLELEGKIKTKLPVQSGTGARGTWARQDFVIEYQDGNYPAEACFSAWGQDRVDELARYQVGDTVKVSFNVKAREYNGRWYNDLRVWRLSLPQASASQPGAHSGYAPQAPAYSQAPQSGYGPQATAYSQAAPQASAYGQAPQPGYGPQPDQAYTQAGAPQFGAQPSPAPGIDDMPLDISTDDLPF